jgi:SAM-dependent methyltransferase
MVDPLKNDFISSIAHYYSEKLQRFGATPQGVDWNGDASQAMRFCQLSKIIQPSTHFSINDLGCGYGALYDFLTTQHQNFSYSGFDISADMVTTAKMIYKNNNNVDFKHSEKIDTTSDYSIASGLFNVRLDQSDQNWGAYIKETLNMLNLNSRLGFAFNCLTSYSDSDKLRDHLYYANPNELFDFCKRQYSRNIALLHDYDLYEFTILVRKF